MCFDTIPEPAVDLAVWLGTHEVSVVPTAGPIRYLPVIRESGPDLSKVDKDDVRHTAEMPKDVPKELQGMVEDFSQATFEDVSAHMQSAADVVAPFAENWDGIRSAIVEATQNFQLELARLEHRDDGWRGATHNAAIENIKASFPEPATAAAGAAGMGSLTKAFNHTIRATKENIEGNWLNYSNALREYPEHHDQIKQAYNEFARTVMQNVYAPNIIQIAKENLVFTAGGPPQLRPPPPNGPPPPPNELGLTDKPGTFARPDIPDFTDPTFPETIPPAGPDALGDPTQAASNAVPAGLGDAAKQAAGAAQNPTGMGQGVPPGAGGAVPPRLGVPPNKGVKGGGAGGAKGGGGGGAGRGPLSGRPAGAQIAAAGRAIPAGVAPAAGLSNAAGAPGMAPPMAPQRGGDPNAKGHQVIKALRRKKTGEQVMGKADAVVPVVGEPERPQASQPEPETVQPDGIT